MSATKLVEPPVIEPGCAGGPAHDAQLMSGPEIGAGEGLRSLVSALATPYSAIEPHPLKKPHGLHLTLWIGP